MCDETALTADGHVYTAELIRKPETHLVLLVDGRHREEQDVGWRTERNTLADSRSCRVSAKLGVAL